MKCTNKNPHYKSTVEFYNNATQTLTATAEPLNLVERIIINWLYLVMLLREKRRPVCISSGIQ